VAEQARLDLLDRERPAQERVFLQVDLPDRQVVRGIPVALHPVEQFRRERPLRRRTR